MDTSLRSCDPATPGDTVTDSPIRLKSSESHLIQVRWAAGLLCLLGDDVKSILRFLISRTVCQRIIHSLLLSY